MATSKIPVLFFGERISGLAWEAAEIIPWFIQLLSGCCRPRQKTSLFHVAKLPGGLQTVLPKLIWRFASLLGSLSHLSCLEDHLSWPAAAGGGFYSNCTPGSSCSPRMSLEEGRFESLQPHAAVGACDTLRLAQKSTKLLWLYTLGSPLGLTSSGSTAEIFFNLASVTAFVMARET